MTDYCAECGEALKPAPLGGRYACHPDAGWYWSTAEPLQADARGYRQMTGHEVRADRGFKFYRGIQ